MSNYREHEIESGRVWATLSDGKPWVMIPLSQINGMSAEEIGQAVLQLVDDAHITDFLRSLKDSPSFWGHFTPLSAGEDLSTRFKKLCTMLGSTSEYRKEEIADLIENFRLLEKTRHENADLQETYRQLCKIFDGAHLFLQTKKTKMSVGQTRAMAVILELRNGCRICGHLDGHHADNCLKFKTRQRT